MADPAAYRFGLLQQVDPVELSLKTLLMRIGEKSQVFA